MGIEDRPWPNNRFFDGGAVSWNGENDGSKARFGVFQEGLDGTFPVSVSERVWLYEPNGSQSLRLGILVAGELVSTHTLRGEGMIEIVGGPDRELNIVTPDGQGPVTYMCDYPGVEPD